MSNIFENFMVKFGCIVQFPHKSVFFQHKILENFGAGLINATEFFQLQKSSKIFNATEFFQRFCFFFLVGFFDNFENFGRFLELVLLSFVGKINEADIDKPKRQDLDNLTKHTRTIAKKTN